MNSLITKIDDCLNAILVKELRQAVRGKFFWSILMVFLASLSCALWYSFENFSTNISRSAGMEVLQLLIGFLFFTSFLIIPLFMAKKIIDERNEGTNELLQTTTMTPNSIVMGKFLCGVVLILMLFCAFTPFVSFTVFMGGVDQIRLMLALLVALAFSLVGLIVQISVGMLISTSGLGVVFKIISVIGQATLWGFTQTVCYEILNNAEFFRITGHSYGYSMPNAFVTIILGFLGLLSLGYIAFQEAASAISPENSNKSYKAKISITPICIVTGILCVLREEYVMMWFGVSMGILILMNLCAFTESESYSQRILSEIPVNPVKRFLKFPYFTGMANSLIWVVMMLAIVMIIFSIASQIISRYSSLSDLKDMLNYIVTFYSYLTGYCLIGNSIRKAFFKTRKESSTLLISLILFLILGVLPSIGSAISGYHSDFSLFLKLFNPFIMNDGHYSRSYGSYGLDEPSMFLIASGCLLVIGIILNFRSLRRQIRSYFNMVVDFE